jgi:hypothetical protein
MDNATRQPPGGNMTSAVAGLLGETRTSLWGRIDQSQGAFLHAEGDDQDAYAVLSYAKALDGSTDSMEAALAQQPPQEGVQAPGSSPLPGMAMLALAVAFILMLLLLIVLILKRGNNSQGTRTAHGAEQKKGRA